MAVRNNRKNDRELRFFRYDWAISRYRWIDENCRNTVSGFGTVENLNLVHSSSDVKISFRKHISQEDLKTHVITTKKEKIVTKSQSLCSLQPENEAQEIAKGHGTMISVLQSRLLRLKAAQTLWHKDTNALIEYLLRLKDDAVLVDIMPFLTCRVRDVSPEGQALSMGACLEILPALERLLTSKFEDYIIAGLDMIREMVKRWWMQLKAATSKGVEPEWQRCSRSVSGMYMAIVSLSAIIVKVSKRKGPVGEKALVVTRLLDLL
ncbi:uncharacterized protein [Pocillopora verrucosa]|uniref:uncharacterized protein isoform X2 n=1 Tax=Pocillopora verrucosa TaxID=203993 RepID=UPI002797B157|nr:katanin p80 WD40 repeat-containing subunit B1-like isoform X2 [Pocillopora verrucosa]